MDSPLFRSSLLRGTQWLPQFSLRSLLAWMVVLSVFTLCLVRSTPFTARLTISAVMVLTGIIVLQAIYQTGKPRAQSLGRLLFGGVYSLWAVGQIDRLPLWNSTGNTMHYGAVTESLNELAYNGVNQLRGANPYYQPYDATTLRMTPAVTAYSYQVLSTTLPPEEPGGTPQIVAEIAESPPQLVPPVSLPPATAPAPMYAAPAYSTIAASPVPTPFPINPPVPYLSYEGFNLIAHCLWTLIVGSVGGWIATVVYARRTDETSPAAT